MAEFMSPPTPGVEPSYADQQFRREMEDDAMESEGSSSTTFSMPPIDLKAVKPNFLTPREQEEYDSDMLKAMGLFFNNKFMKAKALFESKANEDPLYALGLGSMAFIKAIMTFNETDMKVAMDTLHQAAKFANAQIEVVQARKPLKDTVTHYFSNMMGGNTTGLPTNTPPLKKEEKQHQQNFMSNGALRAHVIKAECCLLISILQLCQESLVGYLKVGLNLRTAYNSYSLVWQEYKKMGQSFNEHMDRDTISAIQFGIGSVHLLLSSLPPKILKIVSAFGWRADKHLGFALLKLCLEGRRIRSPLASMMLLTYYCVLTSFAPQILASELTQPAIECLLDAQQNYPNSAFFLYFAGRVSRLAKNIPLSTQSFIYASEISVGEWAEVEVRHLSEYESAFNYAMELDWQSAGEIFESLYEENYWSPAFCKYFSACCLDLLGQRTDAILAFAEVSKLSNKKNTSAEQYVLRKIEQFQLSGYQDMDFSIPALEILLIWNCFPNMSPENLEQCLGAVDSALSRIYEREKQEYDLRMRELAPSQTPPNYFDPRGVLLLIKASLQNCLGRFRESIVHLNWILDHKEMIKQDTWVVPYAYWEAGITTWGLGQTQKSRKLWESGLTYSKFEFEYRLAVRINLALSQCDEMGILHVEPPKISRGLSTGGRKRMSIQR
ncbi:hypothetical protein BC943DRAFT_374891 [Umbelopsis sp. AD052]|nr:hypothetical protein BC943DRAFT_374891 [Umbelopsis sp. AD052]